MNAPPIRVLIKVCGVTSVADALACAEAGADWVGLNFHAASPRCVDEAVAAEIVTALPQGCAAVGLFIDRPPDEILEIARRVGFHTVQLHGDEPAEDLVALAALTVIRAYRLRDSDAVSAMASDLQRSAELGRAPDAVLVDAYVAGLAGGTGQEIQLDLLDQLPTLPKLILAGGLTAENVAERIRRVRPWMVDVASGVESSPGRKDPDRVAAFIRAAREG